MTNSTFLTGHYERKMHSILVATVLLSILNLIMAYKCMMMRFKLLSLKSSSEIFLFDKWGSSAPRGAIIPSEVENRKDTYPLSMLYMSSPRIQVRGEVRSFLVRHPTVVWPPYLGRFVSSLLPCVVMMGGKYPGHWQLPCPDLHNLFVFFFIVFYF